MRLSMSAIAVAFVVSSSVYAQKPAAPGQPAPVPQNAPASAPPNVGAPGGTPGTAAPEIVEQTLNRLETQVNEQGGLSVAAPSVVDNSWRYRNHNGKWWYWLPSNRWTIWSNGAWVDYVAPSPYPYSTGYRGYYSPSYGAGVHLHGYNYGHHHHGYLGHGHIHGHSHGHSHGHGHGHHGHGGHGHH